MKKTAPLVLQWLAVALMFALPTFWRYELSPAPTWVCTKDGARDDKEWGNTCHGEPTLFHRAGLSPYWDPKYPGIAGMQVVSLDDLGEASASTFTPDTIFVRASEACWRRLPGSSWCWGSGMGGWGVPISLDDESPNELGRATSIAADYNRFRNDPNDRTFRLRRPRPHAWWHFAVYALAAALGALVMARQRRARARAFMDKLEAIPGTYDRAPSTTAYRD